MPDITWYTRYAITEEDIVPGKRLGRRVRHDSRSLAYRWQASGLTPASQLWTRNIPILDQGSIGSCTGNAEVGALGTSPLYDTLPAGHPALDETEALALYSAAEIIDGGPGLPSEDSGSSGLSVCQAAQNAGLISGYTHCLSLADVLDALQAGPVIIGSNWYTSMDSPDSSGLVAISPGATVRGGHEYTCRGVDVTAQTVFCDNSWGTSFGVNGSFSYSWDTLTRLLAEQGDATVSVPATLPAPVPAPVPPVPVPIPVPPVPVPPAPVPDGDQADRDLASAVTDWAYRWHVGGSERVAEALTAWLTAKGFVS